MQNLSQYAEFSWGLLLLILAGILLGAFIALVVFALATPLFIHSLVNEPNGGGKHPGEKSEFHLFTFPEEGKVKIVVRGDRVIRMIMIYAGHRFRRAGEREHPDHWEIVRSGERSENPLEGIIWFLWPWAQYVYVITGAVFTGIYPWQTVHEYELERTTIHRDEERGRSNNIVLEVKKDVSDHLRTRQFIYPMRVAMADTKDKISVNVLIAIKARVKNPHKAAYGTDRWDIQLVNLATNAVTNFTRTKNLDEVLTASDAENARALNVAVQDIKDDEEMYGIEIDGVDLIDVSPNLSDEEKTRLYAEALAKPEGNAMEILGKAKAKAVKAMQDVVVGGGAPALAVLSSENLVKAAEAAKGGTVLIGTGPTTDPTQAAILAELRRMNERRDR